MKISKFLYAFLIISAISFTACQDDVTSDLVQTEAVENTNVIVSETILEDGSITYTAQNEGITVSELTLKTEDDGITYLSYRAQGNEAPTFTEYDTDFNFIKDTPIAIETSDRFLPLLGAIILCCVNAEVNYSEEEGWSGGVGFDCDCFSSEGKKPTPLSPDTKYFSIK